MEQDAYVNLAPWIRAMGSCSWGESFTHFELKRMGEDHSCLMSTGSSCQFFRRSVMGLYHMHETLIGRRCLSSPSSYPGYWVAACWLKVFFRGNRNEKEWTAAFAVFLTMMESLGLDDWREHKKKLVFISSIQSWIASNRESCISLFPLAMPVCCLWKYQFESKWELKSSIFMGEKESCFSFEYFY